MEYIIAKRYPDGNKQSLTEHTRRVVEAAWSGFERQAVTNRWKIYDISPEVACRTIFWSAVLHDVGKAAVGFQRKISRGGADPHNPSPFLWGACGLQYTG